VASDRQRKHDAADIGARGRPTSLNLWLRPSEQIALRVSDCDVAQVKINIDKARVAARDKDRTKTSEDRIVELSARTLAKKWTSPRGAGSPGENAPAVSVHTRLSSLKGISSPAT
jgi:hypothetical protein